MHNRQHLEVDVDRLFSVCCECVDNTFEPRSLLIQHFVIKGVKELVQLRLARRHLLLLLAIGGGDAAHCIAGKWRKLCVNCATSQLPCVPPLLTTTRMDTHMDTHARAHGHTHTRSRAGVRKRTVMTSASTLSSEALPSFFSIFCSFFSSLLIFCGQQAKQRTDQAQRWSCEVKGRAWRLRSLLVCPTFDASMGAEACQTLPPSSSRHAHTHEI